MLSPDYELAQIVEHGYLRVVGIDEVGRGCWAGPVAVGAFVFSPELEVIPDVNDSKKVRPGKRAELAQQLQQTQHSVLYGSPADIDNLGIGHLIAKLIHRVIATYHDGNTLFVIDGQFAEDFGQHTVKMIKADSAVYSVAAASILAKVARDQLMCQLDREHSGYGFAQHKGYGTPQHQQALQALGPCAIHRHSYKPVQLLLSA